MASERGMSGGLPTPALRGAAGATGLRRVTIVASRPDDTVVYLQADYASTAEFSDAAGSSSSAQTALPAPTLNVLPPPVSLSPSPRGNPYSSSRGVDLYSSTQRILSDALPTRLDVHA